MPSYIPKTSNESVKKATGKTWEQWFGILDKAGAKKLPHIEIARLIYKKYLGGNKTKDISPDVAKSGGWWSQMVTVEYERSRGLRDVNQTATGYNVSVHRTYDMPISKLFKNWRRAAKSQKLTESTVRANKSIRYKTEKGKPLHVAMFTAKGKMASRIGFEVMRSAKAPDVEKSRARWKKILESLEKN